MREWRNGKIGCLPLDGKEVMIMVSSDAIIRYGTPLPSRTATTEVMSMPLALGDMLLGGQAQRRCPEL